MWSGVADAQLPPGYGGSSSRKGERADFVGTDGWGRRLQRYRTPRGPVFDDDDATAPEVILC